mgnify:CR=1 FL=1
MQKGAVDAAEKVARSYVQGGPHLWISQMLYKKGNMSTNALWDEYQRDRTPKLDSEGNTSTQLDMIPSKTFLKERILL